ncbi:polyketide synthase dehydratase domain-containing protein [Pseudoxanthomonas suwonensis]|uniref:Dehydratase n=1 Tax=Pseudoxanthomonas suwonensis TaxID=314722 RepID=A0A0E3Z1U2_9GAMM|nr:polyketide synthase dehydratase domain-containing protein [Pseudoxanthomonas suwonensis]AKC86928.1 dehydratase [Pseudoxanthomonas suwonensis]
MRFVIPHDHPCLAGHFPGRPLVPGVVLLERVLEAIEAAHGVQGPLRLPQVKFLRPLLPDREAQVVLDGSAPRWRFEVLGADGVLARGEVQAVATGDAGSGA